MLRHTQRRVNAAGDFLEGDRPDMDLNLLDLKGNFAFFLECG